MKRYGSIYLITDLTNNKRYVGQTVNSVSRRFQSHLAEKRNRHISNAIRSHGAANFTMEEVYTAFSKEELNNAEIYFVELFQTMFPRGYNHRAGGNQNGTCSDELRKKISKAKTGKTPNRVYDVNLETRLRISKTLGGKMIKATNLTDGRVIFYNTAHQTKLDGHNPSNVVSICKKSTYRTHSKGWTFEYFTYANPNGSVDSNESSHVQRLELETAMQNRIAPRAIDSI